MFVDLKCVLRSRIPVSVNRSPLNMLRSRNCIRSLLMLYVNLMLWCALLSLSRKLSSSLLDPVQMHRISSM